MFFLRSRSLWLPICLLAGGPALLGACERTAPPAPPVVVYSSIDEPFARGLLDQFTRETGLAVQLVPDTEAGKTTGLLRRIEREAPRPRADVWWSSEIFGTIALADAGLLAAYDSPGAADLAPEWRDPQQRWTAVAARARVIAFDPSRTRAADLPQTWEALLAPPWNARTALANPLFGTTRGHWAVLSANLGEPHVRELLKALHAARAVVADGNSQVVRLVAAGAVEIGWTDTDDVWVAQARGAHVELAYPLLREGGPPLWIPCTVALIRDGPNPTGARRLLDFLVSAAAEEFLYRSDARHIPVRPALRERLAVPGPAPVAAEYARAARELERVDRAVRDILLR